MRVDPHYVTNLVSALNQAQADTQNYSTQISSGVRVTSLSSDPLAAGQNVRLLNQIQQDDSFTQSADLVTGQLQVADSALGQVVSQLTQVISLATGAINGTMNAGDRQSIASQIAGIRDEVLALANTNYQGQYIFSGSNTGTAPFSLTATTPATVAYGGNADINMLESPSGQRIQLNLPGDQIFCGAGSNGVFTALNNLIADFSTPSLDTATANSDAQALTSSLTYLSQQRVTLDDSITQLSAASSAVSAEKTQLTVAQTDLMQADVAQLATKLSVSETQQTALESVISQLASGSLFDHLR